MVYDEVQEKCLLRCAVSCNGSRGIKITHDRPTIYITRLSTKSLKILSAQECGDELVSGITGTWRWPGSVIDRRHIAYLSYFVCISLPLLIHGYPLRIFRLFFENFRRVTMLFSRVHSRPKYCTSSVRPVCDPRVRDASDGSPEYEAIFGHCLVW
jgi:hypothetical protein